MVAQCAKTCRIRSRRDDTRHFISWITFYALWYTGYEYFWSWFQLLTIHEISGNFAYQCYNEFFQLVIVLNKIYNKHKKVILFHLFWTINVKIQDGEPNDRMIAKLCDYASKNPIRIPKVSCIITVISLHVVLNHLVRFDLWYLFTYYMFVLCIDIVWIYGIKSNNPLWIGHKPVYWD